MGQEIVDLSAKCNPHLNLVGVTGNSTRMGHPTNYSSHMHQAVKFRCISAKGHLPFPENTKGVFYYHEGFGQSKLSGGLRFRLCDRLAEFSEGQDLESTLGEPWAIDLYNICRYRSYTLLRNFLVQEGLVDEDLVSDLQKIPSTNFRGVRWIYSIDQAVVLNLQQTRFSFALLTSKALKTVTIYRPVTDVCTNTRFNPYKGLVRVRFELSTLPEHTAIGPTLVMRCLDLLTPVECVSKAYDNFLQRPEPGQLFLRRQRDGNYRPWAYPLKNRAHGEAIKDFLRLTL
ncbi:hypothetical protein GALMADRAFT_238550 [Galerina marginata CBS 339.88]|uniref:Uncharacterized protein n=1 Tax=Galerina marginata (strain CBS 339.88) TaxID=685588 RepID=A0A067TSM9_GALM3|nr:hypothetical protein GALMADRAFT_238550 [Galerina marginata CBS 339.88]